jgi:protein-L-isoaspartate(D-aspartate) O-methyltransferase
MLEMLNLQPGQRVLEIGAGTGFNAALMAAVVGESGTVITMDIDEDIVASASEHLAAAGSQSVRVLLGDGSIGCEHFAPYDRIILTVGADDVAPAWRDQLRLSGILVLPLALRCTPRVIAFERVGQDMLVSRSIAQGGFMPLRGADASQSHLRALQTVTFWHDGAVWIDPLAVERTLDSAERDFPTGVFVDVYSTWSGWSLWLELHEPAFAQVYIDSASKKRPYYQIPALLEGKYAALVMGANKRASGDRPGVTELVVRCYGESDHLAGRLGQAVRAWQQAGSPAMESDMQVSVFPATFTPELKPGALLFRKHHMTYMVEFLHQNS